MNSALMGFQGKSSHAFQTHKVSPPRPVVLAGGLYAMAVIHLKCHAV